MNRIKGVLDLMDAKRYKYNHIKQELIKHNIPGNWNSYQNIYNLVQGNVTPKDAYIYILFAKLFEVDVNTILYRYSSISTINTINVLTEDVDW